MADEIKKDQEVKEEKCCCCEEAKAEAPAEEKKTCECGCECEESKKEAPAEEKKADCKCVAFAKSLLRIVILVAIIALIGFFVLRGKIMEYCYGQRESGTIRTMIEKMITDGIGQSYKYEISYFDEGQGKNNGYKVVITDGKTSWEFTMFGTWDAEKKEPKIEFHEGETTWNMLKSKAAKAKAAAAPAAAPEAAK